MCRRRANIHIALDTIASDFTDQQRALLNAHNSHSSSFTPLHHAYNTFYDIHVGLIHQRAILFRQRDIATPLRNTLRDALDILDGQEAERVEMEGDIDRMREGANRAMGNIIDGILDIDRQVGLEFFPRPENDFDPFTIPQPPPPYVPRSPTPLYAPRIPSPPLAAPIPVPPPGHIRDSVSGSLIQLPTDPYNEPGPVMPLYSLQYPEPPRRSSSELSYRTVPEEPKEEEVDQLLPSPIPSPQPLPIPPPSLSTRSPTPFPRAGPSSNRTRRFEAATRCAIEAATRRSPVLTRRRSRT
ncbi:hypothetical protein EUX98_g8686 [Antrodiella citrinella]|uniref:Uncharacterized protein n=1 Tax=Antrodiella citrinella TaxID=2447956 RepID=A0A4S4M4I5_9APHY|nr:hypothetical protein EUX98_g8686 [Antrodiella citrinella]